MESNKRSFNREDLAMMVKGDLDSKYKGILTEAIVDDVIVTTMSMIAGIIKTGGSVTFRPWGKFVQKVRKPRSFKAPTGKWVSKPGKLVMGFDPFRAGKTEVQGSAE